MSMPSPAPSHNVPLGELPARALEGVRTRRMLAILFDLIFVTIIVAIAFMLLLVLGVLTFGLSWLAIPFLYPVVALFYNGMTISGPNMATPGMRMMDLEMRLVDGHRVPFIYAAVHAVLFYLSWTILTPLILVVALVSRNKRCLHDMFASVVVTRRAAR
jgi:uncharacterized RDD family membrane protein YckC